MHRYNFALTLIAVARFAALHVILLLIALNLASVNVYLLPQQTNWLQSLQSIAKIPSLAVPHFSYSRLVLVDRRCLPASVQAPSALPQPAAMWA